MRHLGRKILDRLPPSVYVCPSVAHYSTPRLRYRRIVLSTGRGDTKLTAAEAIKLANALLEAADACILEDDTDGS